MSFSTMEHRRQRGLTLIELMIAMVLGLLVTLAVVNLFLTTRRYTAKTRTWPACRRAPDSLSNSWGGTSVRQVAYHAVAICLQPTS